MLTYLRLMAFAAFFGIISSLVIAYSDNYELYSFFYAFGFSIVNGVAYMVPVYHAWSWFPNHSGLVSGIIIGSIGLGAIIFDQISLMIVNPHNIQAVEGIFPTEVT